MWVEPIHDGLSAVFCNRSGVEAVYEMELFEGYGVYRWCGLESAKC